MSKIQKYVVIDDFGRRLPVMQMSDIDHKETNDPFLACAVVAQLPDGQYWVGPCEPENLIPENLIPEDLPQQKIKLAK
jgi:hypothetical protein